MKKCLFMLLFFLGFPALPVQARERTPASFFSDYVPGEVLVKFKPGLRHLSKQAIHDRIGARRIRELPRARVQKVKIPEAAMTIGDALAHYRNNPFVEFVEPNYVVHATAVPDDLRFDELWGLNNTGQTGGTEDADIDAPEAWDIHTGSASVVVAVIDSGVAYAHPDLADGINSNIWTNAAELAGNPGLDDDANGYEDDIYGWDFLGEDNDPTDYNGHGTHVAGTIAALGNNDDGIAGVSWTTSIMPLRFLGPLGYGDALKAAEAIYYAADNGAKVINASWGGGNFSQTLHDAISYANDKGCLFVAAAGNSGLNNDQIPFYPASYDLPNVIAVAATDDNDTLAAFSNFGATSVDVAAPGVTILSSVPVIDWAPDAQTFSEDFESGLDGWVHDGVGDLWGLTETFSRSPTHSLADSPGQDYLSNSGSYVLFDTSLDLVDKISILEYDVRHDLAAGDYLLIGGTIGGAFNSVDWLAGTSQGDFRSLATDLSIIGDFTHDTKLGFYLNSNESGANDGVYIDDVALKTQDLLIDQYDYAYYDGTSMAAPHVTGLAALIWAADGTLSVSDVRTRVLNGVEVKGGLQDKMVTAGRINAYNSLQNMPSAPTNLLATTVSDTQINLTWSDNSYGEEGFRIERKLGQHGFFEQVGMVHGNTISYSDTALSHSTAYYYRVRAFHDDSDSPPSNVVSAKTSAATASAGGGGGGGCFVATAMRP